MAATDPLPFIMKTMYLIRIVTIFICLSSIDWYLTASWKVTAERGAWEMNFDFMWFFNFDFQEIFIVLCSWTVIKFYCTYKIDICEKKCGPCASARANFEFIFTFSGYHQGSLTSVSEGGCIFIKNTDEERLCETCSFLTECLPSARHSASQFR